MMQATLRFGDYELDFARQELRQGGRHVPLQTTPLRVLLYLAEHRDRTVPRQELFDAIWPEVTVGDESLTRALAEIRRAVGDDGGAQRVIRTQKGAGYRFVAEGAPQEVDPRRRTLRRAGLGAGLATIALAALAAAVWLRPPEPPAAPQHVPFGVAVLPIANLGGEKQDQELADGLTEQITHQLSQNGYPVVARTTAAQWREKAADVRELGTMLGVSHVLEGSVRRDQDRVRVTMQVVATDTGMHVWSETFEEPSGDLFAIQDKVTDRVAVQVYRFLWGDAVAMERDPQLARIRNLLVESRRLFLEDDPEDFLVVAARVLDVVPEREPYLRVLSETNWMMSFTWANLYAWIGRPFSEAGPRLLAHAEAAVALAPDSAWAHVSLSRALAHYWKWDGAEREMRRACELAPREDSCGAVLEHVCAALGCVDEQVSGARIWARRAPLEYGAWAVLAKALGNENRLDEAEAASLRSGQLGQPGGPFLLPNIQWRLGLRAEAVESKRQQVASLGAIEAAREIARRGVSSPETTWRWIAEQQAAGTPGFSAPNMNDLASGATYAELGDMEAALAALERSVAEHEPGMEMFGLDPVFDPIRDTPRFRALIEKMGLTAYQEKYGVFERARQRASAKPGA